MNDERLAAAEEVCWTLMLQIDAGGLKIPAEWRAFLGEPLRTWADLAVRDGIMASDEVT